MSGTKMPHKESAQEMLESLFRHAAALYGQEQVNALRPNLERLEHDLWLLSNTLLPRELEPEILPS